MFSKNNLLLICIWGGKKSANFLSCDSDLIWKLETRTYLRNNHLLWTFRILLLKYRFHSVALCPLPFNHFSEKQVNCNSYSLMITQVLLYHIKFQSHPNCFLNKRQGINFQPVFFHPPGSYWEGWHYQYFFLCNFKRKSTSSLNYSYLWAVLSIVMVSRPRFLELDNGSKTYLTEVGKSKEVMHENDGMSAEDIIILTIHLIYVIIINSNECRFPLSQSSDASVYPCNT